MVGYHFGEGEEVDVETVLGTDFEPRFGGG